MVPSTKSSVTAGATVFKKPSLQMCYLVGCSFHSVKLFPNKKGVFLLQVAIIPHYSRRSDDFTELAISNKALW